jgi:hypothetical protein
MQLVGLEVLGEAHDIAGEMVELQRAFVVVRVAVAARIPGGGAVPMLGEELDLAGPVAPVAADAVEKQDQLAMAGDRNRKARCRLDEGCVQLSIPLWLPRFLPHARGLHCPSEDI